MYVVPSLRVMVLMPDAGPLYAGEVSVACSDVLSGHCTENVWAPAGSANPTTRSAANARCKSCELFMKPPTSPDCAGGAKNQHVLNAVFLQVKNPLADRIFLQLLQTVPFPLTGTPLAPAEIQ